MIKYRSYHHGSVYGMHYHFGKEGDKLPMHNHKEMRDEHNVICLAGAVLILGPTMNIRVDAGEISKFDSLEDHTIIAMHPGSKTLHLYTNGRPELFIEDFVGEM